MKSLSILGSTGSIGRNALQIIAKFPDRFSVRALAANTSIDLLAEQIRLFRPEIAVVGDAYHALVLKKRLPDDSQTEILHGQKGLIQASTLSSVDAVVAAMVGAVGLVPVLEAIRAKKHIALANKETLVMAGTLVMDSARKHGVSVLPIDSEHSAIFQCLQGNHSSDVTKIILTCSGGPFRCLPQEKFSDITLEQALNHPNWSMGEKITIDSATLMNKGLEIIEASHLFGLSMQRIEVLIHPQSIIHSMVAYRDGSILAQLGIPDMKTAIAYALSYPERLDIAQPFPDFARIGSLTFETPDKDRFPCLQLAIDACETGGTLPAVMNAANETAVRAFLNRDISFMDIPKRIRKTMNQHSVIQNPSLDDILQADQWARKFEN
jgi:1-deoxy-D-xylulose-5-phosphate reductoisomerase